MAEGKNETRTLKVGDEAPDFELKDENRKDFKLSEQRGKNVVLNFFPAAFSGVCTQQMPRIEEQKALFGDDSVVVGISVDGAYTLKGLAEQAKVRFALVAEYYQHGEVAERTGQFRPGGVSGGAVIGIDKKGAVAYINVNPILEVPDLTPCSIALGGAS